MKKSVEQSFLDKDLSLALVKNINIFMNNVELDDFQRVDLINILEEVYHEAYTTNLEEKI